MSLDKNVQLLSDSVQDAKDTDAAAAQSAQQVVAELCAKRIPLLVHKELEDLTLEQLQAIVNEYTSHAARITGIITQRKKAEQGRIQQASAIKQAYLGMLNIAGDADGARNTALAVGAAMGLSTMQVDAIIKDAQNTPIAKEKRAAGIAPRVQKQFEITVSGTRLPSKARSNGEVARILARNELPIGLTAEDMTPYGDTSKLAVDEEFTFVLAGKGIAVKRVA